MKINVILGAIVAGGAFVGCTSYRINPMPEGRENARVIVLDNPKVTMKDVGPRLAREFESRGFKAEYRPGYVLPREVKDGDLIVSYTALRNFNLFAPYPWLGYAEINVRDVAGREVAYGRYKQRAGFWALNFTRLCTCSRTKLRPLFGKMFENYPRKSAGEY